MLIWVYQLLEQLTFGLNKMKDTQIQIFVYNILTSGTNELLLDEI